MARKGILSTDISRSERPTAAAAPKPKPPAPAQRGAVGALQSSLTKLQESAVQDIDPGLIDDAGAQDRLGIDAAAQRQLVDSLRTYGQQVPVLLRPHPKVPQRYEIVYGRRRLMALKELGMPVKAMIRQLDDHALVMAQGQENTSRQDLSFIEKASFAAQLQAMKYDRQTIAAALSIDLPMVSRLLKIGTAFELDLLRKIGSAPSIGRDRWAAFAKLLEAPGAMGRVFAMTQRPEFAGGTSDDRFELLFERAKPRAKAPAPASKPRPLRKPDGTVLGEVRSTARGTAITVVARSAPEFETWVNANAETLMAELHERWEQERSEDD